MNYQTNLTAICLADILRPYEITDVHSYQLLSGGSENSNYLVKTPNQAYVLTLSEQKSFAKANELAALLNYLDDNDFTSSKIVKTKEGQVVSSWNNKPVMVKEYLDGDILNDLSPALLTYLGVDLAKLHLLQAPDYLPKTLSYGIDQFDEIKVYAANSGFFKWLKETQLYIEGFITTDLPKAMIHSDIFTDNIIVSKDRKSATIMDFEEASYYYRVFDIGMMIIGTCCPNGEFSLSKAKSLLKGYQQSIKLDGSEVESLQAFTAYGATTTAFWRHQNFNYVNVDITMKDHYLTMKNLADDVMAVPDDLFRQSLGI
jgi:homoserine kinase type II